VLGLDPDPHLHGAALLAAGRPEGSMGIVSVALGADEHHRAREDALASQRRGQHAIVARRDDLDARLAVDHRRLLDRAGKSGRCGSAISSVSG
jgi:hypothetical protein